jgi:LysR family transcriptional regulator, hypochlorite-specific transcription factor HypT
MRLVNRPFETIWLQDFLALSDSGSFSRAAEERHVAQPAFSRRIRSLEEWLGATLIDRSTHPASLTEAGIRFRPLAADILHRVASAREETRTAQATAAATLRFAATHALSLTFFPAWIRGLESRMRGAPIHLISDSLQACEELMLHGRAQLLLCHYHPEVENRLDPGDFQSVRVGKDTLIPVVAPHGPVLPELARAQQPREKLPVLSYSDASGLGRILRMLLGTKLDDAQVEFVFTAHLAVVLKSMAVQGRGVAWLPESLIREDMAAKRLVPAGTAQWSIPLQIRLFRRRGLQGSVAEEFWKIAKGGFAVDQA